MSVDLSKLNRPGVMRAMTQKTGLSQTEIIRRMSGNQSSGVSLFNSRRGSFVAGTRGSGNPARADYTGIRNSLNVGAPASYSAFSSLTGISYPQVSSGFNFNMGTSNSFNAGFTVGSLLSLANSISKEISGKSLVQNVADAIDGTFGKSSKTISQGSGAAAGLNSSGAKTATAAMSACTDSASLGEAISSANGTLAELEGIANQSTFENITEKAQKAMSEANVAKGKASKDLGVAKGRLDAGERVVNAKTTQRNDAIENSKKVDAAYGEAQANYAQAKDNHTNAKNNFSLAQNKTSMAKHDLDSANAALKSTPEKIDVPDGNGGTRQIDNPQYKIAKARAEEAKVKFEEAEKAEKAAKEKMEEAEKKETEAEKKMNEAKKAAEDAGKNVSEAEKAFNNAQADLEKAKENQTAAQKDFDTCTHDFEQAQISYDNAKQDLQTYNNYKNDVDALKANIQKQTARQTQLKEKETKKYNELNSNINKWQAEYNKLNESININDGVDKQENKDSKKLLKLANDISEARKEKEDLGKILGY